MSGYPAPQGVTPWLPDVSNETDYLPTDGDHLTRAGITGYCIADDHLPRSIPQPITPKPQTPKTPLFKREWLISRGSIKSAVTGEL